MSKPTQNNTFLLVIAVAVFIGGVYYGFSKADSDKQKKRERLEKMEPSEIAQIIIEKNPGTLFIDPITRIDGISYRDNVLTYPYIVTKSFLNKLGGFKRSKKNIKQRLHKKLLQEDCTKTSFSVFMQKGGVMYYTYHLEKEDSKEFLFDFNHTWDMCSKTL